MTGFDIQGAKLAAVRTDQGAITCDRAVIAAGIRSKELAKAAGDRVSLESERAQRSDHGVFRFTLLGSRLN